MKKLLDSFVNIFLVVLSIALVGVMIALPVILLGTCIAIIDNQPTTFELVKVAIKGAVVIYLVPKFLKIIFLVYKVRKSEYKKFKEYKIKDRELKIWQEPGFAVLIAITLILGGYLIGAFLWD